MSLTSEQPGALPDSSYAWLRLCFALALMTIGSVGMYATSVALRPVQAEFGVTRSDASLPYTLTMIGFALGGIVMGRLADRFGVMLPLLISAASLGFGFVVSGLASTLWQFDAAHGLLIGFLGISATFAPLAADASLWFTRRRGIAVAICTSGNFLAGAIWPPVLQHFFESFGWRQTFVGVGVFCAATMLPLALALRRKPPLANLPECSEELPVSREKPLGLRANALQALLCVAGVACCVAMSMPLVHIVAYCGDLGYAAARGAEMLSLMLGFGILSRLAFGWISDRLGGLRTLLLGSALQCVALALFLPAGALTALYAISTVFGMFFGGIVPAYAIIVREHFPPREAGVRMATTLGATFFGMALGAWMSGAIFDLTGSYRAAFLNGVAWNLLNITIIAWLLYRSRARFDSVASTTRNV